MNSKIESSCFQRQEIWSETVHLSWKWIEILIKGGLLKNINRKYEQGFRTGFQTNTKEG